MVFPITIAIFGTATIRARRFDTDSGSLSYSAIGIEDAQGMWML